MQRGRKQPACAETHVAELLVRWKYTPPANSSTRVWGNQRRAARRSPSARRSRTRRCAAVETGACAARAGPPLAPSSSGTPHKLHTPQPAPGCVAHTQNTHVPCSGLLHDARGGLFAGLWSCHCLRYALCNWPWCVQLSHTACAASAGVFVLLNARSLSQSTNLWLLLQLMRPHCRRTWIGLCSATSLPSHSSKLTC